MNKLPFPPPPTYSLLSLSPSKVPTWNILRLELSLPKDDKVKHPKKKKSNHKIQHNPVINHLNSKAKFDISLEKFT